MRFFVHLSFNGTHYHGWQIQKNAPGVQAFLEDALSRVLGELQDAAVPTRGFTQLISGLISIIPVFLLNVKP